MDKLEHDENVDKDKNYGREEDTRVECGTQLLTAEHKSCERFLVRVDDHHDLFAPQTSFDF